MSGFLDRLGLGRKEGRAWALYDVANSAFVLTVQTAIYPIFFYSVAGAGLASGVATQRHAWTTSIALVVVGVMAPILGALADYAGLKKRLLAVFLLIGVIATGGMFFIQEGMWVYAAVLFALANIGAQGSFVFYDSLLPHVAGPRDLDRLSTAGFALGYLGSAILFAIQIAWIQNPAWFGLPSGEGLTSAQSTLPVRLAFLSVGLWWLGFSIPLFRHVREPATELESDEIAGENPLRMAFVRLSDTFRQLKTYRQALLMLLAFVIYNDGIGTIIRMASIYATEIGISATATIGAIFLVQLIGVPFAFMFGHMAGRIGPKRAIFIGLTVYIGVTILGYFMTTATHFYMLAILVGMVQGGTQALSRSLFASLVPRHKSSEFFGFYGTFDKFAGMLGPTIFGLAMVLTGSSRNAILSVAIFFIVGAAILTRVNVEEGREVARRADAGLVPGT